VALHPDDRIFTALQAGCCFRSKTTQKSYLSQLTTIRRMCGGRTLEAIIGSPDACISHIEKQADRAGLSPHSVASYATAILAAIKHGLNCKAKERLKSLGKMEAWQSFHKAPQLKAQHGYLQNRATSKQQSGWVPHSTLCEVRDSLPVGSLARLLFCMYTFIPPVRADLGECRIFNRAPTNQQLASFTGNYVVLPQQQREQQQQQQQPQQQQQQQQPFLHLRQFKTSRSYGGAGIKTALPPVLVNEIVASLEQQPRKYLFVQQNDATKPYSRAAFSAWANKTLQRHTGNPHTNLQILRHAYVSAALQAYDPAKLDPCDQAGRALCEKRLSDIAHAMGHSTEQQRRYQLALNDKTGLPKSVGKKLVQHQSGSVAAAAGPIVHCHASGQPAAHQENPEGWSTPEAGWYCSQSDQYD